VDDMINVTNDEICAAIKDVFEGKEICHTNMCRKTKSDR
jgi:hypothetical protein